MRQKVVLEVAADSNHSYYCFLSFKIFVSKGTFYHVPTTNWKFGAEQNNRIHGIDQNAIRDEQREKMALDKNFDDIFFSSFHIVAEKNKRLALNQVFFLKHKLLRDYISQTN